MAIQQLSNFGALKNATQQIRVRPQELKGIAGFIFDITERESIRLESDITDHYIENNSTIQDHIALKPIEFGITGMVGELVYDGSRELGILGSAVDKLQAFSPFLPEITQQANQLFNQAQNLVNKAKDLEKSVKNIYGLFNDIESAGKDTKQAKAFEFFKALWENRQYFEVDTPWATFNNMAIMSLEVDQTDNNVVSSFTINFKQLRFSQILLTAQNSQGRRAEQVAEANNKGKVKGETILQSTADKALQSFFKG